MSMGRTAVRVITGSAYLAFGVDVVRDAGGRPQIAADTLAAIRRVVPLPADDTLVVRQRERAGRRRCAARFEVMPRIKALALVESLVPTTLADHAFWTGEGPALRKQQQTQFIKNLAMLAGLLYVVVGARTHARF